MNEEVVLRVLREEGVDLVASLPCDKNKRLTALLPTMFEVVDLAREEDGVGICAGAFLAGRRPVLSIQSSGLGNMLNALLSLSRVYDLPLPILASWRGVWHEAICAQVPFNEPLPRLLDVYRIPYRIFSSAEDLEGLGEVISGAFALGTPFVALILPSCWEPQEPVCFSFPPRSVPGRSLCLPGYGVPEMTRLEAISAVAGFVSEDAVIVSNIGVPSKELYAVGDRAGNFYMLGSYMQAAAIGLGCAMGCPDREVYVIDGDGSLLGSAVLPVVAAVCPGNLRIVALDNGTFGSTGNQMSPAYATADLGMMALAAGVFPVERAVCQSELTDALSRGVRFVHTLIVPRNSASPNIPLSPAEIRDRFMAFLRCG